MDCNTNLTELTAFRKSVYIDCQTFKHDASDCKILQSIVDILNHYEQQSLQNPQQMQIYKHIVEQNYDIPTMMEDWQQCKNNHLQTEAGIDCAKNMMYYRCDNGRCEYNRRHTRDREYGVYDTNAEVDLKDIIVMDQLDSIHAFIFHSFSGRNQARKH
eukprot:265287_1